MRTDQQFSKPGFIINSDKWASYNTINRLPEGYQHHTVNHSQEFVTSDGIHTNSIEATWWSIKRHFPKKCDDIDHDEALSEKIWRRKHHEHLWEHLFIAFKYIHY